MLTSRRSLAMTAGMFACLAVAAVLVVNTGVIAATQAQKDAICAVIEASINSPTGALGQATAGGPVHINNRANIPTLVGKVKTAVPNGVAASCFDCLINDADTKVCIVIGQGTNNASVSGAADIVIAITQDSTSTDAGDASATNTQTAGGAAIAWGGEGHNPGANGTNQSGGGSATSSTTGGDAHSHAGNGGGGRRAGANGGDASATTGTTGTAHAEAGDGGDPANNNRKGGDSGAAQTTSTSSGGGTNTQSVGAAAGTSGTPGTHGLGGSSTASGGSSTGQTNSSTTPNV